jgi:hypothetical protein
MSGDRAHQAQLTVLPFFFESKELEYFFLTFIEVDEFKQSNYLHDQLKLLRANKITTVTKGLDSGLDKQRL